MFIDICFLICFWVIELLLFCLDFGNTAHPNAPLIRRSLKILGKVVSVQLKAEPDTDEVFAQITLIPVSDVSIMGLMVSAYRFFWCF
ncbi:hypothetical protein HanRHA438_Chr15g0697961 [Helianthus annuus]|nr:hypothetical protein HanLR1_Chr15g0569251 [Helianthus annuus]KAJ0651965.1 hypothetical protein HanOQP8_Chr15g0566781 [Helianthus annuus]KAJ0830652.1 hypothetical protein HanPSC8_Chr15g0657851 [Helianthus annuus]KAJ0844038.1 hypothetical protein HanRHA438_Chr15g0697961 [Helianthus annuus]